MMRNIGINMRVNCLASEVLKKLVENRDRHKAMVQEARIGYVERARRALEQRLGQILEGKVVALSFQLNPPLDYTNVYDTAIHMLTSHRNDFIELGADEYRHLMDDTWDWSELLMQRNSPYSGSTRAYAVEKGFDSSEE